MTLLIIIFSLFIRVLSYGIILRVILSWFIRDPNNPLMQLVSMITDPILVPFRKATIKISGGMGLDLSPLLAIISLNIIQYIVVTVLQRI